ncbi:MAG: hypothetical protein KBC17_01155 [Candidatus Pacebacteria bacterium]|nr:hypothetical protein [Candidatus Paceibacterota bacterium]
MRNATDKELVLKYLSMNEQELLTEYILRHDGSTFAVCRTENWEFRTHDEFLDLRQKITKDNLVCPFEDPIDYTGLSLYGFNGLIHRASYSSDNLFSINFLFAYSKHHKLFQQLAFDYDKLLVGDLTLVFVEPRSIYWKETKITGDVHYTKSFKY